MLSGSFFSNKRRHLDIAATARDYLCVSQLLDTLPFTVFSLNVYFEGNLDFTNKFNNMAS